MVCLVWTCKDLPIPGTPRPAIFEWMEMVISNHFQCKDLGTIIQLKQPIKNGCLGYQDCIGKSIFWESYNCFWTNQSQELVFRNAVNFFLEKKITTPAHTPHISSTSSTFPPKSSQKPSLLPETHRWLLWNFPWLRRLHWM